MRLSNSPSCQVRLNKYVRGNSSTFNLTDVGLSYSTPTCSCIGYNLCPMLHLTDQTTRLLFWAHHQYSASSPVEHPRAERPEQRRRRASPGRRPRRTASVLAASTCRTLWMCRGGWLCSPGTVHKHVRNIVLFISIVSLGIFSSVYLRQQPGWDMVPLFS